MGHKHSTEATTSQQPDQQPDQRPLPPTPKPDQPEKQPTTEKPTDVTPARPSVGSGDRVTRRELRELSDQEKHRLVVAFYNMQNTNDWGCIAGIHGGGLPDIEEVKIEKETIHCHHGVETFPVWHRAYLYEFEKLLQKHDPWKVASNAPDRLTLPFWDWSSDRFGAGYPDFLTWPRIKVTVDGKEKTVSNPLASGPSRHHQRTTRRVNTSNDVAREIQFRQAAQEATAAMMDDNFWDFSNRSSGPTSLETPHDDVHVSIGGDMGRVNDAAWDPIFWFHHCNVERLYYSWQRINPAREARTPDAPLEPFFPRDLANENRAWTNKEGPYSTQKEWFHLNTLDYEFSYYATAPPKRTQMRDRKRYVVFWDVPKPAFSVSVYVYIKRVDTVPVITPAPGHRQDVIQRAGSEGVDDPNCAGAISIFAINKARSDTHCTNCEAKAPIPYFLDVTNFLENLSVRKKDEVKVTHRVTNEEGEDVDLALPEPDILWDNEFLVDYLDTHAAAHSRDAKILVSILQFYGYKEGDSVAGLSEALKKYQEYWGLEVDGILGPLTQEFLQAARSANADVGDATQPILLDKLRSGKRQFKFTVTAPDEDLIDLTQPDYGLGKGISVLNKCFAAWATPLGNLLGERVSFEYIPPERVSEIDVEITWKDFDGPGGTLACASSSGGLVGCSVQLDRAERWTLKKTQKYSVRPVVTHELGHLFGLSHTNNETSIMNPFYRPDFVNPSNDDIEAVITKLKTK